MRFSTCPPFQKGFSLVEVIIAVFITGALILVIANIPQAISLVTGSKSEASVREVVAKKIEDLRLSGYDNLSNGTLSITDPKLNPLAGVSGNVITEDCPIELCTNGELIKKITITISWNENAKENKYSVSTFIAKGGLR